MTTLFPPTDDTAPIDPPVRARTSRRTATVDANEAVARIAYSHCIAHSAPETAKRLLDRAQEDVRARWRQYEQLAGQPSANSAGEKEEA